jgi:hypothetical protein
MDVSASAWPNPFGSRRRRTIQQAEWDEVVQLSREGDAEANADTSPPQTDRIRLRGLWMTEAYPVSHQDRLERQLRRLMAARERLGSMPADHLARLRRSPGSGGSSNLGPFVPPGAPYYAHMDRITSDVPNEFKHAHGWLIVPMTGIAFVTFLFVPTQQTESLVDDALRRRYETYGRSRGTGIEIFDPDRQKRLAVDWIRDELRQKCATWLSGNLPGLFANPATPLLHPTLEAWTCEEATPFGRIAPRPPDYVRILRWNGWWEAWRSDELGAVLTAADADREDRLERPSLLLVGRDDELLANEDWSRYHDRETGLVHRLNYVVSDLMVPWTLQAVVRADEMRLTGLRSELNSVRLRWLGRAVRRLADTERQLLEIRADAEATLDELAAALPRVRERTLRSLPRFVGARLNDSEDEIDDIEWVGGTYDYLGERAARVRALLTSLVGVTSSLSTTVTARINLRMQRQIWVLTAIASGAAVAALLD